MRTLLISVVLVAGIAPMLGGCVPSMNDMRTEKRNGQTFSSAKKPDQLSGCIATAWAPGDVIPATTQKTERGWTVHHTINNQTLAVADITPSNTGSSVSFASMFERSATRTYVPAIMGCL